MEQTIHGEENAKANKGKGISQLNRLMSVSGEAYVVQPISRTAGIAALKDKRHGYSKRRFKTTICRSRVGQNTHYTIMHEAD